MSDRNRRRLLLLCSAFLIAVVVTGMLVPILQKRLEKELDLAPLSEIEIGDEPGKVQFAPTDGATNAGAEGQPGH